MAIWDVDDSSLPYRPIHSLRKSVGLVWGLAATWQVSPWISQWLYY